MAISPTGGDEADQISALPTKAFFVEMFTKDIALEQAVLDLVDNSVDGARRMHENGDGELADRIVHVSFSRTEFHMWDNCGGFSREVAKNYAFRFGRPPDAERIPGSIGRFGVGMKRALFKFGDKFTVQSATELEEWAVKVDVKEWSKDDGDWHFPWSLTFEPKSDIGLANPGTDLFVKPLHLSVANTFATKRFHNSIVALIKSRHRVFIDQGLRIVVNDEPVQKLELTFLNGTAFKPSVWNESFDESSHHPIKARVIAGLGDSVPKQAGWYVICNGRIILDADRRDVTGWGTVEDKAKSLVPTYHGQFARFRGVVSFESADAEKMPWNTTKTDVDQDSDVWRTVRGQMVEMMRPVIDFLNDVDADIQEVGSDKSPLVMAMRVAPKISFDTLTADAAFDAPDRQELPDVERWIKIQYSRKADDIDYLKDALNVRSAAAVGERSFDLTLQRQRR